jgi:lipopolysaccharide export system protein LptC
MVRGAKWLMPLAAAALLGIIAFWPEIEGHPDNTRVSFRRMAQPKPEGLRVVNPLYHGVDDLNRPYTVTAREAVQPGSEEVLDLDRPTADILLSNGAWVYLRADSGRYDRPARRLDLKGAVTIYHDNGTMMLTDQAQVLLDAGSAEGEAPVAAQGPFGTLVSEGFRLTDRGARVEFTGRAQAVLEDRP